MASVFSALNVGSGIDVRSLVSGLVAAERAPRQALLDMVRNRITDADGFDRLAEAFDQLARFSLWQKALAGEQQAFDMVVQSPAADAVDQQINEAQAAAIRASRLLLRESWRAAITADLGRLAERLNALFGLIEQRRQHPESRCNPKAERTLASAVSGLTRPLPLWTAPADLVPAVLPLTDSLFDLVIVDEADRLSAAAIMPLLVRGRRAMVFGSLIEPGSARSDGFALMLAGAGAIPFRLDEHLRSHAAIGDYLSHAFHGGALRIHSDHLALRPGFSSAQLGLHWHHVETADPAETDDASTGDPEIDGALKLVAGWCEAGVLGGTERVTVGIVTPVMDALPALAQGIAEILPAKPAQERIVLGPPERFETQPVDLLVVLPRIAAGMPARHARYLAANRTLYHEAVGAARIGVHIVGDRAACRTAGGYVAALLDRVGWAADPAGDTALPIEGDTSTAPTPTPRTRLAAMLDRTGLAWSATAEGFRVFTKHGGVYRAILTARTGTVTDSGEPADSRSPVPVLVEVEDLLRAPQRVSRRIERLV